MMICKKAISTILVCAFFLSSVPCGTLPSAFADASAKQEIKEVTTNPEGIIVSREFGVIKSRFTGKSGKLIVHIQDAHCNYEAQSNIAKIIEGLIKNNGLSFVSVEGADGLIDTSWFKSFPDAEVRKEVANYFMKKGEITGPEFLSITTDYPIKLYGAETREYYIENLNAFTASYPLKEETEKYFNTIKAALNKLKGFIYNAELKAMDEKGAAHEAKSMQFNEYVRFLQTEAEKHNINLRQYENLFKLINVLVYEKKIDFNLTDKERSALIDQLSKAVTKDVLKELVNQSVAFKVGKVSSAEYYEYIKALAVKNGIDLAAKYPNLYNYIIYNSVYSRIDNEKLFQDIKTLETDIKEKLFDNDDQRTLERLSRHINTLLGLVNIKLLNGDFEYYKTHKDEFSPEAFDGFIKDKSIQFALAFAMDPPSDVVARSITKLEDFYVVAIKRDSALVDNTLEGMAKADQNLSVLVTGGFHSEGMTKLLERADISYVVVCPSITKDVPTPYIQILTNQRTSFEDILVGGREARQGMLAPALISWAVGMSEEDFNTATREIAKLKYRVADAKEAWIREHVNLWLGKALQYTGAHRLTHDKTVMLDAYRMAMERASASARIPEVDGKTIISAIMTSDAFTAAFDTAYNDRMSAPSVVGITTTETFSGGGTVDWAEWEKMPGRDGWIQQKSNPSIKAFKGPKGYDIPSGGMSTVVSVPPANFNLLTPDQEKLLNDAAKQFKLVTVDKSGKEDSGNKEYLRQMWIKYLKRINHVKGSQALTIITDPDILKDSNYNSDKDPNFILMPDVAAILGPERAAEVLKKAGIYKYSELSDEKEKNKDSARNATVTINSLDGGIGANVGRLDFVKYIARKYGKMSEEEVGKIKELGAKGTDLGFIIPGYMGQSELFISIAEAKIMQLVEAAKDSEAKPGIFQKIQFQPVVNKQSKGSYDTLLDKTICLEDRFDTQKKESEKRTYRQFMIDEHIDVLDMMDAPDFPGLHHIDSNNADVYTDVGAPVQHGGHGNVGFLMLRNTLQKAPPSAHHVRVFLNGENINSRPNEHIVGAMVKNKWPVVKLTTRATRIDVKGGKDGLRVIRKADGTLDFIPDQMEVADAKAADKIRPGQLTAFYKSGLDKSKPDQPFNTNIFYINTNILHEILVDLEKKIGVEALYQIISPTLMHKIKTVDADKPHAGEEYVALEGAIGTAMHNLNAYFLESNDPKVRNILKSNGRNLDQLLFFVDVPRTEFFTPIKKTHDLWFLMRGGYYTKLQKKIWTLDEADVVKGKELPEIDIQQPYLDKGEMKDGYWNDVMKFINNFGEEVDMVDLKSLKIRGPIVARNTIFIGDVVIINKSGKEVDLPANKFFSSMSEFWTHRGNFKLKDVVIIINSDGTITASPKETIIDQSGVVSIIDWAKSSWEYSGNGVRDLTDLDELRMRDGSSVWAKRQGTYPIGDFVIMPDEYHTSLSQVDWSEWDQDVISKSPLIVNKDMLIKKDRKQVAFRHPKSQRFDTTNRSDNVYVFDYDGTLAPRNEPMSNKMADMLAELLIGSHDIAFVTAKSRKELEAYGIDAASMIKNALANRMKNAYNEKIAGTADEEEKEKLRRKLANVDDDVVTIISGRMTLYLSKGAEVYNGNLKLLKKEFISSSDVAKIWLLIGTPANDQSIATKGMYDFGPAAQVRVYRDDNGDIAKIQIKPYGNKESSAVARNNIVRELLKQARPLGLLYTCVIELGGNTSIDVTPKNKGNAIRAIAWKEYKRIIFIGDDPENNDRPIFELAKEVPNLFAISVSPRDTKLSTGIEGTERFLLNRGRIEHILNAVPEKDAVKKIISYEKIILSEGKAKKQYDPMEIIKIWNEDNMSRPIVEPADLDYADSPSAIGKESIAAAELPVKAKSPDVKKEIRVPISDQVREKMIQERAYFISQSRPTGSQQSDWSKAVAEINAELNMNQMPVVTSVSTSATTISATVARQPKGSEMDEGSVWEAEREIWEAAAKKKATAVVGETVDINASIQQDAAALSQTLVSIGVDTTREKKKIMIAYDTKMDDKVDTSHVATASGALINRKLNDEIVFIRGTGSELLEKIRREQAKPGKFDTIVTIAGDSTITAIGQDNLKDMGTVINVHNPENMFVPVAGLFDLALRIAYEMGDERILECLNRIAVMDPLHPELFTLDALRKGIIRILPKIRPIDMAQVVEAYKAAQAILTSL